MKKFTVTNSKGSSIIAFLEDNQLAIRTTGRQKQIERLVTEVIWETAKAKKTNPFKSIENIKGFLEYLVECEEVVE